MSMSQTAIGVVALVAIGSWAIKAVAPDPVPITINSLTYADGIVTQDRTIETTQPAFYAQWAVTVERADTGESLLWCEGNGANAYPPGTKAVAFTLADWTGRAECTPDSLPAGVYALRGSWRWGDDWTSAKSAPFEVVK